MKQNFIRLKAALTSAFSLNSFAAYEAFVCRRFIPGEAVDVHLSDLRRLARLVHTTVDDSWIKNGWLVPYFGQCDGVVPLMAVVQNNTEKIRPVLDYRELNQFVSSHTGESVVCGDKLRSWRRLGTNLTTLDFRKAYVTTSLWSLVVR